MLMLYDAQTRSGHVEQINQIISKSVEELVGIDLNLVAINNRFAFVNNSIFLAAQRHVYVNIRNAQR